MSPASSNPRPKRVVPTRLGNAGVTSLEFAIVALVFLSLIIGCMDLGRYYIIEHSLRSFASEAARAALANTTMSASSSNAMSYYSGQAWSGSLTAIVPFLDPAILTLNVSQNPNTTGVVSIDVTATYQFTAISPIWNSLNGTLTETTKISY